ncbi:hypothetical protein BAE42_29380 [Mesorhizobium loti]|nr:hypothetical protein BAE42_29380 [Mesorhizobium loti]OBQ68101.1 hypothetical protein A8146_12000 [Mesorhizobium loti]
MQKALTQMNLQLQHAGTDSTGQTGLRSMPIRVAPPRQPLIDLGPMARANATFLDASTVATSPESPWQRHGHPDPGPSTTDGARSWSVLLAPS